MARHGCRRRHPARLSDGRDQLPARLRLAYGVAETLSPLIRRVVARNPAPSPSRAPAPTSSDDGSVAVIDPGPALQGHIDALLAALTGETVSHILITHTHLDHSPAAAALKRATAAPTLGFGPHGATRSEGAGSEEGADREFVPDLALRDGDVVEGKGWRMTAVHTPGHTSNHLCFALAEEKILFSGDHVMGWSTSVIAPPDGDMAAYLHSLAKLLARDDAAYWPTHGPAISDPHAHVRAFIAHRHERAAPILGGLPPAMKPFPPWSRRSIAAARSIRRRFCGSPTSCGLPMSIFQPAAILVAWMSPRFAR